MRFRDPTGGRDQAAERAAGQHQELHQSAGGPAGGLRRLQGLPVRAHPQALARGALTVFLAINCYCVSSAGCYAEIAHRSLRTVSYNIAACEAVRQARIDGAAAVAAAEHDMAFARSQQQYDSARERLAAAKAALSLANAAQVLTAKMLIVNDAGHAETGRGQMSLSRGTSGR